MMAGVYQVWETGMCLHWALKTTFGCTVKEEICHEAIFTWQVSDWHVTAAVMGKKEEMHYNIFFYHSIV